MLSGLKEEEDLACFINYTLVAIIATVAIVPSIIAVATIAVATIAIVVIAVIVIAIIVATIAIAIIAAVIIVTLFILIIGHKGEKRGPTGIYCAIAYSQFRKTDRHKRQLVDGKSFIVCRNVEYRQPIGRGHVRVRLC